MQAGTYIATAVSAALGQASANGNIPLVVQFEITDGEYKGETISAYLYFTSDANTARSIESLRHCGYAGDDLEHVEFPSGNRVQLVCADEEWQGEVRTKVKWINRMGGNVKRLEGQAASKFAAKMRAAFKSCSVAPAKFTAPVAPVADERNPPPPDDEIF